MAPIISFHSGTLFVNWGPLALEFHWAMLTLLAATPVVLAALWFSRSGRRHDPRP